MPRKIRELVQNLEKAGFRFEVPAKDRTENSHSNYAGAVTLIGKDGDDAKQYQEKQVTRAIEEVQP